MIKEIKLKGHLIWIIPLIIIILTASFTLYTIKPTYEFFKDKEDKIEDKIEENTEEKTEEKTEDKIEDKIEEKTEKKTEKKTEDKIEEKTEEKLEDIIDSEEELLKIEKELLNLRKKMNEKTKNKENNKNSPNVSKTLEEFTGDIQGYNCGNYSEFLVSSFDTNKKYNKKYLYPNREVNKSGCIKHTSKPNILEYETDVNSKILEYESMNILPDYRPEDINILEKPALQPL